VPSCRRRSPWRIGTAARGAELLRALVLGYDLCCRSTQALGPRAIYAAGRSSHALGGLFGAAAAAGALAGLGADQMRWLLSYIAQQASGIRDLGAGRGAQRESVRLRRHAGAQRRHGCDHSRSGLPRRGRRVQRRARFFDAFAVEPDPEELARELGARFDIMGANIKKWSVGSPIQAALDSLEVLVAEHRLRAGDVKEITVRLPDVEAHIVDDRSMPDINLQHLLAVMLLDGGLSFASSHDVARMRDPAVLDLKQGMTLIADRELSEARPRRQGIVEVTTNDGRKLSHRTYAVRGTADNPMRRDEVEANALDLLATVLGAERARMLVDRVWDIERLANARELRPLLEA
jgi:2-methylcitrate dehydratase PrpD